MRRGHKFDRAYGHRERHYLAERVLPEGIRKRSTQPRDRDVRSERHPFFLFLRESLEQTILEFDQFLRRFAGYPNEKGVGRIGPKAEPSELELELERPLQGIAQSLRHLRDVLLHPRRREREVQIGFRNTAHRDGRQSLLQLCKRFRNVIVETDADEAPSCRPLWSAPNPPVHPRTMPFCYLS